MGGFFLWESSDITFNSFTKIKRELIIRSDYKINGMLSCQFNRKKSSKTKNRIELN